MIQSHTSEEDIFKIAHAIHAPDARQVYLQQACGKDSELYQRVVALLDIAEQEQSFLERPAAAFMLTVAPSPIIEKPGDVIGAYKLREQIGEGGFGVVYVAEQERPVRRKVALKIIKPGMDTKDVIARFEAERQALALMDHPNVARVIDAGATESGRPYFVMELVHGVSISEYCDRNKLCTRDRLLLFADVCRAIQHAHQKGIIHRDLKPSNIMVTLHDGKPVVKVIDFGVSKALSQQLTEKSIYTAFGQMIGTPSYMSPEQAEMSGLGIDTRSDIYSLGVLLYELLTGKTPLDAARLRASAYAEILRIIKEEEPPRPSLRISTLGKEATVIAEHRHTDPLRLRRDLIGELDWIVMKCLEKDRARRYETANGLARDIERYLSDEPVEACPPSWLYRFRKLAHKHRGLLATALSIAAVLVAATLLSAGFATWAIRAQRQTQTALKNEQEAHRQAVAAKELASQASLRLRAATEVASDGIDYYNRSNWTAAHERFTKAAEIEPGLNTAYIQRGALYTRLGLWERATADYDRRFRIAGRADVQTCYEHALLQLHARDTAGYQHACQALLRQHQSSPEVRTRYHVLRSCLLAPEPVGDAAELVRRTERLVAAAHVPWHVGLLGRVHLLAGNYENAVVSCREAIKTGNGSPSGIHRINYLNLAMALYRQGKHGEAKEALAFAEHARDEWIKTMLDGMVNTMPVSWTDWLECNLLYRETRTMIDGHPPGEDPRLIAIHERALAAIKYGDVFSLMDTGRDYAKRREWERAAASFASVLDKLPPDFLPSSQEMRFCLEIVYVPEVFEKLVELRSNDYRLWYARGRMYASSGEWAKAISDYEKTLALITSQPLTEELGLRRSRAVMLHELAALKLLAGDESGYRRLCESIIGMPAHGTDDFTASSFSRTCTLSGDGASDWSVPLQLANDAVKRRPRLAWYLYAQGIAQHRAGNDEQALQALKKSLQVNPTWLGRGQNFAVLSLVNHRLARHQEARQWLNETRSWLNEANRTAAGWKSGFAASLYLNDWLSAQVLLSEAEKLTADQSP